MRARKIKGLTPEPRRHLVLANNSTQSVCGLSANPPLIVVEQISRTTCPACITEHNHLLAQVVGTEDTTTPSLQSVIHFRVTHRECCSFGLSARQRTRQWRETGYPDEVTCPACSANLGSLSQEELDRLHYTTAADEAIDAPDEETMTSLTITINQYGEPDWNALSPLYSEPESQEQLIRRCIEHMDIADIREVFGSMRPADLAKILASAFAYHERNLPTGITNGMIVEGYDTVATRIIGIVIGGGQYCNVVPVFGSVAHRSRLIWSTVLLRADQQSIMLSSNNRPSRTDLQRLRVYYQVSRCSYIRII